MIKYVDTLVTFSEIPDEITLCINISNCPCHCINCHSSYLAEDIGEPLDLQHLTNLIDSNKGITCVCIMGGDANPSEIDDIAQDIKEYYPELKVGWYSGRQELDEDIELSNFDVIKLGGYNESLGPLNCPTTNQRFYKIIEGKMYDYTYLFWKDSEMEIWRDIDGFDGYQVSNLGNVRSLNYNGTGNSQRTSFAISTPSGGNNEGNNNSNNNSSNNNENTSSNSNKSNNQSKTDGNQVQDSSPKTGDENNLLLWVFLLFGFLAAFTSIGILKK